MSSDEGYGFPAARISIRTDARTGRHGHDAGMARSYAVIWRDGEGPVHAGKLVLGADSLRLDGASRSRKVLQAIRYEHLGRGRFASGPERLRSLPTLLVEHGRGLCLALASVEGSGSLQELAALIVQHGAAPSAA
jgi:hypothetical protein